MTLIRKDICRLYNVSILFVLWATILLFTACNPSSKTFTSVDPSQSGIHFNNVITPNDSMNILDYEYLYNGGGVGIGDFNNDGLDDVYFTGNMVDNVLYLNEGNMKFKDITQIAGVSSIGSWSAGIAVVDINADGLQDIYVCNNTFENAGLRKNNLFINQGTNADGVPTFIDQAEAYGLDDDSYSVNSAFFDYDNDGDLDVMIIINEMQETRFPSQFQKKKKRKATYQRVDRLYENRMDDIAGHPVFVNVSEEAGITIPGFSLGINIVDINQDGWKDVFITNDFLSNDIFYVNQKDGTFKDESKKYFKHTSHSAMGNDVVDINNDGLHDIIALDMLPEDNYRQKKLLGPNNYTFYLNNIIYDYTFQYVRNTLQLNQGMKGENEEPVFSEISMISGISATDWSWTPLIADFDNDLNRDIIVTNGFPKDVTDHDFVDYKANAVRFASKEMMLEKIPSIKSKNCGFRNTGDLGFENVTDDWGLEQKSYSNGAAYADFDNDGDLDFMVNNIDDSVFVYQNNSQALSKNQNYLQINLTGSKPNIDALGARVYLKCGDKVLFYEHSPFRGYLSTHSKKIHFGLGNIDTVESVRVIWPSDKETNLINVLPNQLLTLQESDGKAIPSKVDRKELVFHKDSSIAYIHEEDDFIDYNLQPLLPHKLSEYGPGMSVGDVNNDGFEDIYISGSVFRNGSFLMGSQSGTFSNEKFIQNDSLIEELGSLLFDADADGDLDLYLVSGSYEIKEGDERLQDRFFEQVNGDFIYNPNALPKLLHNGLAIKSADVDQDGDLDIFVGGRVMNDAYPEALDSYLLENVSDESGVRFKVVNEIRFPGLHKIGMVTDAIFTDVNQDGWADLIIVGEFTEINVYINQEGTFEKQRINSLIDIHGFWNSIAASDLDGDGDQDYILGNRGLNQFNPIDKDRPFRLYVHDFDQNGSVDVLPFAYYKNRDNQYQEFPFMSRLDFSKEINSVRRMFQTFESYATADINTIFTDSTLQLADVYEANYVETSVLLNKGNGNFELKALPKEAQFAPVYGILSQDFDQNGTMDILLIGNDFGNEIFFGRQNALNGLLLSGQEDGSFLPLKSGQSGFYVPGNAKSLVNLYSNDKEMIVSAQNRGPVASFFKSITGQIFKPEYDDFKITYTLNGKIICKELQYGSSFVSQSTRRIVMPPEAEDVQIIKYNGEQRNFELIQ